MSESCWFVYIVRCSDNSLYCGTTVDLSRRIKEHNASSRGAKYTRSRRPVKLVWSMEVLNRSEALKLELKVKKLSKKKKELLVESNDFIGLLSKQ